MVCRVLCWLGRMSYRVADHIITVNGSLETIVYARGRLASGKVTVVGNGPVLARARKRPAQMGLKDGKRFLCCWLGFMGPQDRVDVDLRAVAHLAHVRGRPDCHCPSVADGETTR